MKNEIRPGLTEAFKDFKGKYAYWVYIISIGSIFIISIIEGIGLLEIPSAAYLIALAILLFGVVDYLASIQFQVSKTVIYPDQNEYSEEILSFIKNKSINQVDMIEYSGVTVHWILNELMKKDCRIRLLLYDPRYVEDELQRERILVTLKTIPREYEYAGKGKNLELGFYNTPPSLRGCNFDNQLIVIGWYVFFKVDKNGKEKIELFGHDKPVIAADTTHKEMGIVEKFFNDQFEKLWDKKTDPEEIKAEFNLT